MRTHTHTHIHTHTAFTMASHYSSNWRFISKQNRQRVLRSMSFLFSTFGTCVTYLFNPVLFSLLSLNFTFIFLVSLSPWLLCGGIFSSLLVQSFSSIGLFATPWKEAHRTSCPSPSPGACSNSCPLSQWCDPNILSSVVPFSSCLQSFPVSGSFYNEWTLSIRWPKFWSFSFSMSLSNEYSGLISL